MLSQLTARSHRLVTSCSMAYSNDWFLFKSQKGYRLKGETSGVLRDKMELMSTAPNVVVWLGFFVCFCLLLCFGVCVCVCVGVCAVSYTHLRAHETG